MDFPSAWLSQNWFNAVQTVGILGSTFLAVAVLRRDTRSRQGADYLTLTAQHRELWSELHRRPELARVSQSEVDLIASPISVAEQEFLRLAFNHFHAGWLLVRQGGLVTLDVLSADADAFLTLPIPRAVWERWKHTLDPEFVHFMENPLAARNERKQLSSGHSDK